MSATYGHNIIASEALCETRVGARLASSRPRQRIEVEPAKADRIMWWVSIGAAVFVALVTYGGGL